MTKYFPQEESFFANEVAVGNEEVTEVDAGTTNNEAEAGATVSPP